MFASIKRTMSQAMSLLCLGLLAFNASAAEIQQKGTHLRIQFDKDSPDTILIGMDVGSIVVLVNDEPAVGFANVRNISIKGGHQSDYLAMSVEIEGNLTIKSGAGDDSIYVSGIFGKNVKVNLGDGDDIHYESENGMSVGGSYSVKAGKGNDYVYWDQHIVVGKSMSIDQGAGAVDDVNEEMAMHGTYVYDIGKKLSIKLAKEGGQVAVLQGVSASQLIIRGGKGKDTVDLSEGANTFGKIKLKKIETLLEP
jgi:hypothetical protein